MHDVKGYIAESGNLSNMQLCSSMDEHQSLLRERIRRFSEATGLSYSALAQKAGLSHTTLTRFMNDPDVTHVLSTRTLAKLDSIGRESFSSVGAENPGLLEDLGRRIALVRRAMAPSATDEAVAVAVGWTEDQMAAICRGEQAPSLTALTSFANRMRVTTDFLLFESLEGLSRAAERRLLDLSPDLGLSTKRMGDHKGTARL